MVKKGIFPDDKIQYINEIRTNLININNTINIQDWSSLEDFVTVNIYNAHRL
jgi:hypothetical protein